ncbi:spore coat protein U domain-containing protein [Cellvibrio polysaccharolyticus]|uniref:Spore coat protein U/FanG domain-containing protein n=1 Tax=Cellvibrio polysaccharolyticus TaxID=2082724 RepID=A0A928V406_9GAMM|nr:spore coat protein U domain-containing protein [Cellvibrio polysaccharolyticus]MBE8716496.1 hypothetical protein [Cellvibrio polysaccharolyticus]
MTSLFNLRLIGLLATGFFCNAAYANCTVASTTTPASVLLGTHSTKVVSTGGITSGQITFLVQCTVTLGVALLGGASTLSYTVNNPLLLTHSTVPGEQIAYEIASNTTFNPTITTQGGSIGGSSFSLLSLALLASQNMRIPVYVRSGATSRWPRSGTYNSNQILHVSGSICTVSLLSACIGVTYPFSNNVTMPIQLEVSKLCEFISVTSDVSFGGSAFMDQVAPQTLTARVQCTHGDTFKIYANAGAYHNGTHRQMDRAGVQKIAYDIYHPGSTTNILTQANGYNKAGTGLAEDIVFPVRVIAGQTTPAMGNYQDTVRLVIEY